MDTSALNDLEPLICDADNMLDVLMSLLEDRFTSSADENLVLTCTERNRIFFAACVACEMSQKVKKKYYAAFQKKGGAK
jgi:ribosomal protein S7